MRLLFSLLMLGVFGLVPCSFGQEFKPRTGQFEIPQRNQRSTPSTSTNALQPNFGDGVQDKQEDQAGQSSQESSHGVMGEVTNEYVELRYCFAELIDDVDIPAEETGKLIEISVKKGDNVGIGTQVARINDQRAQRMREEAQLKFDQASRLAVDDVEINAANKRLQLATEEFGQSSRLAAKGSESQSKYKRALYSKQIAELELEAARNKKELALLDSETLAVAVKASNDSIARHTMRSTLDGSVAEVTKNSGEWVQAGETVMRIARMDQLRIKGFVDANRFNPHEIKGCKVVAEVRLARDEKVEFPGVVTFVSMESHSDKFEIEVEIENRKYEQTDSWIIRVGSEMNIRIYFEKGSIASRSVPKR